MRKVDAEALAARITAEKDEAVPNTPYDIGYSNGLTMAYSLVIVAPTIEERRGRWVDRYGGKYANPLYECSECKESALYEYRVNNLGGYYTVQQLSAHCPNCGAKMDGGAD